MWNKESKGLEGALYILTDGLCRFLMEQGGQSSCTLSDEGVVVGH